MQLSRSGLLALAFALTLPATAHAQRTEADQAWRFGALGGWSFPTGDLSDVAKSGYNLGAFIERTQLLSNVSTRIEYLYTQMDSDIALASGDFTMWTLTANGIVGPDPSMRARPYLIAGLGLGNFKADVESANLEWDPDGDTGFTYNIGGGLRFRFTRFDLMLESRFVAQFTDFDTAYHFPVSLGIRF